MPVVSPYFNHYNSSNEQNLLQSLIDEALYNRGIEVLYIPRQQDNIDYLFNEDPAQYYDSFKSLAAYPLFTTGFDGQEMMSMFGDEFQKSGSLVISKRKFKDAFPDWIRPKEGDLIYMPITNAILEIKYVDLESEFFDKGKTYVYEIKCEAFEYSYEDIKTGDMDFDKIINDVIEVANQDTTTEPYGDNSEINADGTASIEFSPDNPFGV